MTLASMLNWTCQEESVDYNIETTAKYLKRAAPMKQWLEMEIGITGLFDAQGTTKISANPKARRRGGWSQQ